MESSWCEIIITCKHNNLLPEIQYTFIPITDMKTHNLSLKTYFHLYSGMFDLNEVIVPCNFTSSSSSSPRSYHLASTWTMTTGSWVQSGTASIPFTFVSVYFCHLSLLSFSNSSDPNTITFSTVRVSFIPPLSMTAKLLFFDRLLTKN